MDIANVMLEMDRRPRTVNRRNNEFVEAVDREFESGRGKLITGEIANRNFIVMAVIKGVYLDSDLGNYDTVLYIAHSVTYKHVKQNPITDFSEFEAHVIAGIDELQQISDSALFTAGFFPNMRKKEGLDRDFFVFVGQKGYETMSKVSRTKTQHRRFKQLSSEFANYADSLTHTARKYLC